MNFSRLTTTLRVHIAALGKLSGKDIEVLVFADNPSLMMSSVYVPRGCMSRVLSLEQWEWASSELCWRNRLGICFF